MKINLPMLCVYIYMKMLMCILDVVNTLYRFNDWTIEFRVYMYTYNIYIHDENIMVCCNLKFL